MGGETFLSRWSKKKIEARAADPTAVKKSERVEEPLAVPVPVAVESQVQETAEPTASEARQELPPIESLTPESDFRPFLKPDVDPQTRNNALKALFKDPHYNVMDRLDIYIDDYTQSDPIPASMLRKMTQSKSLRLFDDEEAKNDAHADALAEQAAEVQAEADRLAASATPEIDTKLGQNDAVETKSLISPSPDETEHHPPQKQAP